MESKVPHGRQNRLEPGLDYPRNYAEFLAWFPDEPPVLTTLTGFDGKTVLRAHLATVSRDGA